MSSTFRLTTDAPEWVPDLPRDYRGGSGTVTEEAGVIQEDDNGNTYWKAFQLIEMEGGNDIIRPAYYTEGGNYQNKPLMLPPDVMADLTEFAEGKLW